MVDNAQSPAIEHAHFLAGLRRRLEMWWWSLAYVFLAVPAVVLFCLLATSLSVVAVGVGMLMLLALVPITSAYADLHRRVAGHILGTTIERPYLASSAHTPWALLRSWAVDPARWRDFGWTFVTISVGWVLSWLAFGIGLAVLFYLIYPLLYWVTPDGGFDVNYGIYAIESVETSFISWVFMLIAAVIWWNLGTRLVYWRAQLDRALLGTSREQLERRVSDVTRTRTETLDHSAAELRRVERDLHDGTQARLVSLGMSLGMAEQLLASDPDTAARILREARESTSTALEDVRSVIRGIHPPVLADRGLVGAVRALALDMAIPVTVQADLLGRPPVTVESAMYFAVAECLANIGKHSAAHHGTVIMSHDLEVLRVDVRDDGRGGAQASAAGLTGVARRLEAFDGTMDVTSPDGGPTTVTMEVPCALSSPKTTPS